MSNSSENETFIVEYSVGDGCTYSYDFVAPAQATSLEALISEFELRLSAYDPKSNVEKFMCGGRTFAYEHFIYWTPKGKYEVYDFVLPTITPIDDWVTRELK